MADCRLCNAARHRVAPVLTARIRDLSGPRGVTVEHDCSGALSGPRMKDRTLVLSDAMKKA